MRTRLLSLPPAAIVLLLLGFVLMLFAGRVKEKYQLPLRILALILAFIGAIWCFIP